MVRQRDGFTLIEVMGAMVIFTGGVLMVLSLASSLGEQLTRAGVNTEVVAVAREQLDSLQSLGYDGVSVGSTSKKDTIQNEIYTVTRTVTQRSSLVRTITISMTPDDGSGPTRSIETMVATTW